MGKKSRIKTREMKYDSAFDSIEQIEEAFIEVEKQLVVRSSLSPTAPSENLLKDIIEEYMLEKYGKSAASYIKMIELSIILREIFSEEKEQEKEEDSVHG